MNEDKMNKTWFYLWNMGEEGGKQVKDKMGLKAILHERSTFKGSQEKLVINWGSSITTREVHKCKIINRPEAVALSINKVRFFETVGDKARTVPWTTDGYKAIDWAHDDNCKVYCRTQIKGREGKGIVIVTSNDPMPQAKLYTKEVKSTAEYRVHVVDDGVIAVHKKVNENAKPDNVIRNTANGWRFKWVNAYNPDIASQAAKAVKALGLDFAAVDVLWDGEKAWVLETNTSPGIDGMNKTVERYAKALTALVEKKRGARVERKGWLGFWR